MALLPPDPETRELISAIAAAESISHHDAAHLALLFTSLNRRISTLEALINTHEGELSKLFEVLQELINLVAERTP